MKQNSDHNKGLLKPAQGAVSWESPANIAIVKYWGKYPVQLPMNPSLSFVLKNSVVRLRMEYHINPGDHFRLDHFSINGHQNDAFKKRIAGYLEGLDEFFPFLKHSRLRIQSTSTFPHSAGIASSAAAFSALALCLCSIESEISPEKPPAGSKEFFHSASFLARLGSGSACRSVYDGMVAWGRTPHLEGSSDEYAVRLDDQAVDPVFYTLRDTVLIVDSGEKNVSSSAGHALMQQHPYRSARKDQAENNLKQLLNALRQGDLHTFGEVAENEALSLHGLMMSSNPGYTLMHPNSLRLIEKIRNFRKENGLPVCFTMDAGPNVHLLYPAEYAGRVTPFIGDELAGLCENGKWIDDAMGSGPVKLKEST